MSRENAIRQEILMQVYAVRPIALTAERIQRDARKAGYDYSVTEVKRELPFLVGEKLLDRITVPGVTESSFTITSAGIRHYEENFG